MAYRQTPSVEARLQDNRSRILRAARTLVSEGGWKEAQVANVAAVAGIATGTVYRYFPSKADLFTEVLSKVSQREVDVMSEIAASEASASVRLHSAISTFVCRAMRNPRLAYALIAEPCDKAIDAERMTYRAAISEVVRMIIATGQSSAEMRSDIRSDIAASVIVGGFMEALIGPLSPFSQQQHQDTDSYQREVAALADQIATLACTSVAPAPNTVRQLPRRTT
ncbi:TetR/AcrR family transcriptional regulator [Halomonas chromatireducens]|uniref:HTH-type transcriptional repressor KstR n=1 Tax=Halomonas chromatireducens TaxID=507626 RepID=A0A0X8HEF9_9GAMM|nr:TetR/AcrR family transcriptional regulator [Halomonas chromatireducens]AMD01075.1 HTH-type transcriptional repressor KstR [Halomonas chromatireducens]